MQDEALKLLDEIGALGDRHALMGAGWERVWEAAQDHAYFGRTDKMRAQLARLTKKHGA